MKTKNESLNVSGSDKLLSLVLTHTASRMFSLYEGTRPDGTPVYDAEIPLNGRDATLMRDGECIYTLGLKDYNFRHRDEHPGTWHIPFSAEQYDYCFIEFRKRPTRSSRRPFPHTIVNYETAMLDVGEVFLGKDGIRIPIFHNGRQVALIERAAANTKDAAYAITSVNGKYEQAAVLFCLCYDFVRFNRRGDTPGRARLRHPMKTKNRHSLSMYNPAWAESNPRFAKR